uniref:uncharacterized protein LOC100179449 isoform X2 n=1 Tax=Ciona intestinalis TaxID=7719 RepID=UPI000EF480FD|nr:uncharacterized protein LOC100179449 isoform X2 [Ciona intestinalis]|eukprot:XP_026695515.1 uncharacterized protein LOC100179449 isoform X2 [Ciona intestinalis]
MQNLTSTISSTEMRKKINFSDEDGEISNLFQEELLSSSKNITDELNAINGMFFVLSDVVSSLEEGVRKMKNDADVRRNHTHANLEDQVSNLALVVSTINNSVELQGTKINEMESQYTSDMNAIHDTTDENTRIMQELSSSIVEHSLMLSDYKLQQHTLNMEVKSLKNKNPTTIGTWTPPPSTLSALEALVATLQLANTTFNTLVETTSVEIPAYSEYEDQERDSFNTNVYPDVSAFNTEENDKDTNANLAKIFSEILVSVSEILDGVANHQQVETTELRNRHVDNTQVVQLLGRIQSIEDMLLNHSMQNISDAITALSHQIQLVSLERLESYGRNQNMTTEVLDNYSQLSNQVVIQQSEINELLMNILDMNATLSNQVMNDQVQVLFLESTFIWICI